MPTEPAQQALAVFEFCLFVSGLVVLFWLLVGAEARQRWLGTNALAARPIAATDFILIAGLVLLLSFTFQLVAQVAFGGFIAEVADHQGLSLVVLQSANYLGAFVAWKLVFPSLRRSWLVEPDTPPPEAAPGSLPWSRAMRYSAGTLAVALPVLAVVSLGWNFVVEALDLPVVPQDVVTLFTNTRSPWVIAGMLLVACVLAPIYEELLFRAGLYRFCRQRLGRSWSLLISGLCFGALHGHVAGFLPLAVLGMLLAVAYEATGSIRVVVITHGLFNLNTVLILLSGLPQTLQQ